MRRGWAAALACAVALLHARSRGRTRRVAAEVASLDPVADAREVQWLLGAREFPFDVEQALSFALFRTFALPEVATVLAATGEFTDRPRRRYDDTELLLGWMVRDGLDGGRGRAALRRMNAMHAAFAIDPADMAYVLSTFVVEPVRWLARWGWRPTTAHERAAFVAWYGELGTHMGLRDLPTTWDGWATLHDEVEATRFRYHPDNELVARATLQLFLDMHLPRPLHPLGEVVARALLDEPLREATGLAPAPAPVVRLVDGALRTRALVLRHLVPERRTPYDLTEVARPSYPHGHEVAALGTFPDRATRDAAVARRAAGASAPTTP